jgi:anti-sigma factor ChrR (cupin superfamily)
VLAGIQARRSASEEAAIGESPANRSPGEDLAGSGHSTVRAEESPWEATTFPGITLRRLHVDPVGRRMTVLVRMEAGASYVPHRHNGPEESFVLEGTVTSNGQTFSRGDYHRAEAGSVHGVQTTENGCMLLIMSCIDDELLVGTS